MSNQNRVLVKLLPSATLAAAGAQVNLRPLYDTITPAGTFGLASAPTWYIGDLTEAGPTPWDTAHEQIASRLGVAESDILYAEPDLLQQSYPDANARQQEGQPFAVDSSCQEQPKQTGGGRPAGAGFAWHLGDDFSQLSSARSAVTFSEPRTCIAHIDTGYDRNHAARPARILQDLERNFVDGANQPNSAVDPNRGGLFDNSGHGTGTIGILAGQKVAQHNGDFLGGCP